MVGIVTATGKTLFSSDARLALRRYTQIMFLVT